MLYLYLIIISIIIWLDDQISIIISQLDTHTVIF